MGCLPSWFVEAERKIKQATAREATRLGKHEAEDLDGTYDALALLFPRVQSLGHHLQGTPRQGWGSPEISEPGGLQKATGTYLSTPSLLLLTACPVTAPHFRFSFLLPSGLERQWSWEETKLPVICTINHLLYRPPPCLHHLLPTLTPATPDADLGSLGLLDLCLPSLVLFSF